MVESGDTLSVSVTDDDVADIQAFDAYFRAVDDAYSRAGRIKEAMVFYQSIHELMTDELEHTTDPDELGSTQLKFQVRQALLDRERREIEDDVPY